MPFQFKKLEIPEVILIEATAFEDDRGYFIERYKRSEFEGMGIRDKFVQENGSHSMSRVLRGLHYQKHPRAQAKLIAVIQGEIFDVVVDIRRGSPTYGRWVGTYLSADNRRMLYIPVGFAHGFCVVSKEANVIYSVSSEYAPDLDRGILWNDPDLGIDWPNPRPIVSPKDVELPRLKEAEHNFKYEGRV